MLWDLSPFQDRLQINKAADPTEGRSLAENQVHTCVHTHTHTHVPFATQFPLVISSLLSQTIFDTDPKLDHAPILPPAALSSIEHGHSLAASDLHWIPDHIEVGARQTDRETDQQTHRQTGRQTDRQMDGQTDRTPLPPLTDLSQDHSRAGEHVPLLPPAGHLQH